MLFLKEYNKYLSKTVLHIDLNSDMWALELPIDCHFKLTINYFL